MMLRHVNIEPTNRCQLNCSFCSDRKERPFGDMPFQKFLGIIDNLPICELRLFLSGEPLLHEHIRYFISMALNKGFLVLIHSNGLALNRNMCQALISAAYNYPKRFTISFSMDQRIPQKDQKRMRKEIKYLSKLNKDFDYPINIIIQTIVLKNEEADPPSWIRGIKDVKYHVLYPHNWDRVDSIKGSKKQTWKVPCGFIQDSIAIYWNGDVPVCCTDLNGDRIIGNIYKDGFVKIIRRLDKIAKQQVRGEAKICVGCERYEEANNKPANI